jgi:ectoine hydroxylase-related dioxygenase (phytanoyl-CoA dioxygenase family)
MQAMGMHDAFERDGHVIVRGVVPPSEIAALRDLFVSIIPPVPYPAGPDGIVRELTGLARGYPPVVPIATDRRFGALVAEALGAKRVQLLQDSWLYKPPHEGGSVELHQDRTYIGYLVPARVATLRIALEPEDDGNGCMRAVDGSHRWGAIGDDRSLVAQSVTSLVPTLSAEQQAHVAGASALALQPGDISIHHCLTLHGSARNASERPRRTIILRMFDADCVIDRARLPAGAEAYFPTDAGGHLDPSAFPIVHE